MAGVFRAQRAIKPATMLVVVLLAAPLVASAAGPPPLNLEQWNRAFKYEARRVPAALLKAGTALYDGGSAGEGYVEPMFPLVGYDVSRQCKGPGAKVDPTKAAPGTCQYKANADGTFTYWEKQPGDWSRLSNCYCYALNTFKGGWCQPGAASGVKLEQHSMTCASLKRAVLADGAKEATRAAALGSPPASGHYVAMMMRPQSACNFARCLPDFHFLRRDANGLWSHKSGEAPATNRDAQGALIRDPQAAALPNQYTQFCGYFHVQPARMRVGTVPVPNLVAQGLAKWRAQGLAVSVQPLPYNAAVDARDAGADYAVLQQQMFALQRAGRRLLGVKLWYKTT